MSTDINPTPDQQPQQPKSSEEYQGMVSPAPEMQFPKQEELDGEPTLPNVPAVIPESSLEPAVSNTDPAEHSLVTEQSRNYIPEAVSVQRHRNRIEHKGPSLGKKIAVGGAAVLALVGIGAGVKHFADGEPATHKNVNEPVLDLDKPVSEQKTITSTTTTEAPVTEEPVVGEAGNPLVRDENGQVNEVQPGSNEKVSAVMPGANESQLATGESGVVGPESENNTEATVQEAVILTDFLMGNQVMTGVAPTIELGDNGTGTLVFSEPEFTVSVNGLMEEGIIKQDPLDQLKGFNAIEITVQGERVEIRVDKDTQQPALNVTTAEKTASTNAKVFPGEVDENFASTNSRKIIDQLSVFVQNLKMQ